MRNYGATEPIVILGFGEMGQVSCMIFLLLHCEYRLHIIIFVQILAKFLSAPLSFGLDQDAEGWPYVAFDLNPAVVKVRNKKRFGIPVVCLPFFLKKWIDVYSCV